MFRKLSMVLCLVLLLEFIPSIGAPGGYLNRTVYADQDATPSIFPAIEDSYVQKSAPDTNFRQNPLAADYQFVRVKEDGANANTRYGFLKMDLTSFSQDLVQQARLYFYNDASTNRAELVVYGLVNQAWSDTDITWNHPPDTNGEVELGSVWVDAAGWYSIDVSDYVSSQMEGKIVSFRLGDRIKNGRTLAIRSKNHDAATAPYLAVYGMPADNLHLWLKADKGITADADGNVSSWQDQSGNQIMLSQSDVSMQPKLESDPTVINGRPYVQFTQDILSTSKFQESYTGNHTMFFVVKLGTPQTTSGAFFSAYENTTSDASATITLENRTDHTVRFVKGSPGSVATTLAVPAAPWQEYAILTTQVTDDYLYVYLNGTEIKKLSISEGNLNGYSTFYRYMLGGRASTLYADMDLAEVLVYRSALDAATRERVEALLHKKYFDPEESSQPTVDTVTSNQASGLIDIGTKVALSTATVAAAVYYSVDGNDPRTSEGSRLLYEQPITLDKNVTIKAYAARQGWKDSDLAQFTYTVKASSVEAWPAPGIVKSGTAVSLSTATVGGSVYYQVYGSDPNQPSPLTRYTEPIIINGNTTIKAYAAADGTVNGDLAEFNYLAEDGEMKIGATVPWTTYEAESDTVIKGTATKVLDSSSADFTSKALGMEDAYYSEGTMVDEAMGHAAVKLNDNSEEAYVKFTGLSPGNRLTIRYGYLYDWTAATVGLYVNDVYIRDVVLDKDYLYHTTKKDGPYKWIVRNYKHIFLDDITIPAGASVTLRKKSGGEVAIDLIDVEMAPDAIAAPPDNGGKGWIISDAIPNDGLDDFNSITNTLAAAKAQNKDVFLPAGTYNTSNKIVIPAGVSVMGAGLWYTTVESDLQNGPHGFQIGSDTRLSDLKIFSNITLRGGGGYALSTADNASNWTVERVWIQNSGAATWFTRTGGSNVVRDNRIFDPWADGYHVDHGGNGILFENNFVRGSIDDPFAVIGNPGLSPNGGNITFRNNTSEGSVYGRGIAVAGAKNVVFENNLIKDHAYNIGAYLVLEKNGSDVSRGPVENVTIRNNQFIGNGPESDYLMYNRAHLTVDAWLDYPLTTEYIKNIYIENNRFEQGRGKGLMVKGSFQKETEGIFNVNLDGNVFNNAGQELDIDPKYADQVKIADNNVFGNEPVAVTGVSVSPSAIGDLRVGAAARPLTAAVAPDTASDQSVAWSSTNTAVAVVSSTGLVTAVAPGSTTIRAASVSNPSAYADVLVTVLPAISMTMSPSAGAPGDRITIWVATSAQAKPTVHVIKGDGTEVPVTVDPVAGSSGNFTGSFAIPKGTTPGVLFGSAAAGAYKAKANVTVYAAGTTYTEPEAIGSTEVTVSRANTRLAVTNETAALSAPIAISIPSQVTHATVSVTQLLNSPVGGMVATDPLPALNIAAATSIGKTPIAVAIPQGITISAPISGNWDGTINMPTVQANGTVTPVADTGKTATVNAVIEVGFGDVPLTLSKAVRIVVPGMAGKDAAYYRGAAFTKITGTVSADTQAAADAEIAAGGDAMIDVGQDKVIWTKHFTRFVLYTQTTKDEQGGGAIGGGGSGGVPVEPEAPQAPEVPQAPEAPQVSEASQVPEVPQAPDVPSSNMVNVTDINGHWAYEDIRSLIALGAVEGYPDGTFKPDNAVTRAEFVKLLVTALKLQPKAGKVFADTGSHWAKDYISTAVAYQIASSYSESTFGPDDPISREQMAVMIVNAAKLPPAQVAPAFTDNAAISQWAVEAVSTAQANGLMNGYPDSSFNPHGHATRAEAAVVLIRAVELAVQ